ncbi:hypothetical protein [Streptomyces sp. H27-S2]|uniref:hypothetical protein n=1 Tax=Streptomyces antarcticus TaxID=2996458 RepID=UPI002270AA65|nr:hypothetical protein [Streptomyces sp. H27-S2]MCY0948281.1 hypothetical protein [Streptomyces sp. H27-S2]
MRKSITSGLVAAAALGSLSVFSPTAMAAADAAEVLPTPTAAASCVQVVRWYSNWPDKLVEVKNTCGSTACFSVTVAANRDPEFSIGANRQQSFRYGGALWTSGTGIKNIGC